MPRRRWRHVVRGLGAELLDFRLQPVFPGHYTRAFCLSAAGLFI
jgi:hypothetical protein